jgi:cytochrome oxidase Cu insertion factor (SCO1/SenC/PrrC family)
MLPVILSAVVATAAVPAPAAAAAGAAPVTAKSGAVSLAALRGRYVVLAPTLTLCHEVCPLTTAALMQLQRRLRSRGLGDRVLVAEATVDPWRDSPARVRAFKRLTGADVRFLTGTRPEIRRLWKVFGVAYKRVPQGRRPDVDWWTHRPERFDVQHTDGVFIIDPRGRWRVAVPGMPDLRGSLTPRLASLLNDEGEANLRHPDTSWTVDQILDDLSQLTGRRASSVRGAPGRLLGGGESAIAARLRALRGRPVVINEWASWCPPCRREFPLLATAAARFGKRVAFVGLDVNDDAADARRFLARHPIGYPSYVDDGGKVAASLTRFVGLPTTVFLDSAGKVVHTHIGEYKDAATLTGDVRRYALAAGG